MEPGFDQNPQADGIPWVGEAANIPSNIAETVVKSEYRYATIGLIIGGLVALAGVAMILLGVTGAFDLTINVKGNQVEINTAVVGVVIAIVGAAIVYFTKAKLSFAKKK